MGDEQRDVTAIKLLMRNERQYRRLYVLGLVTEPAHSGMQPALPILVETFAPPYIQLCFARYDWHESNNLHFASRSYIVSRFLF